MSERERNRSIPIGEQDQKEDIVARSELGEKDQMRTQEGQTEVLDELNQIDEHSSEQTIEVLPKTRRIALSTILKQDQISVRNLELELLAPIFSSSDHRNLMDLVSAWFEENEYFRAQVQVVGSNDELASEQKLDLILDLLDSLLDEERKVSRAQDNYDVYSENLLLLRKYRSMSIDDRLNNEIGELKDAIDKLTSEKQEIREKSLSLEKDVSYYKTWATDRPYKPSYERSTRGLLIKIILLVAFFGMAAILLRIGFPDLAGVVLGLGLAQLIAEIFNAVGKLYGGD